MKPIIIITLIILAPAAFAQTPAPKAEPPIVLTEAEASEAAAARQAVEQTAAARNRAWQFVLESNVTDAQRSTAAVAVAKEIDLRAQLAESQQIGLLWKHRAMRCCPTCEYSPDYKTFIRSKP
jgi:hypothetical protein